MEKKKKKSLKENIEQLKELWNYFLKRWIIICIFGFTSAGLGLLVSILKKPTYTSTLSFVLDGSSLSSLGGGGLSGLASSIGLGGGASGESVFEGDNLMALVVSKRMIEQSLMQKVPFKNKTYAEYYIEFNEMREAWEEKPHLKKIKFPINSNLKKLSYHQDSILREIYIRLAENALEVKMTSSKVNIINVRCESHSHYFSRHFPETLINEVSKYYIETKTKKAKINYDVLKHQTDSIRVELYNSIAGLASANDNIYGINPAFNIQRVPSARKQVDVQANTAILTELVKNLELARVNLLNNTPLVQIIDSPKYPLEEKKLRKLYGVLIGGFLGGIIILALLLSIKYFKESSQENSLT